MGNVGIIFERIVLRRRFRILLYRKSPIAFVYELTHGTGIRPTHDDRGHPGCAVQNDRFRIPAFSSDCGSTVDCGVSALAWRRQLSWLRGGPS
jgi:hypothetical protein